MRLPKKCPRCRRRGMDLTWHQGIEIDFCVHCGGLWFDQRELEKIILAQDPNFPADYQIVEHLGKLTRVTELPCPNCKIPYLEEYAYLQGNPLKIEVCPKCFGLWLDEGELEHAKVAHHVQPCESAIDQKTHWGHWLFQFFLALPVEFNIRPRKIPYVTFTLIALNIFVYLAQFIWGTEMLERHLAMVTNQWGQSKWFLNLLTYQFIHYGFVHMAGNLYFVYILGDNIEDAMSRIGFLAFYLFVGIMGGVTQSLVQKEELVMIAGASGSVAGLMAAYAFWFRRARLTFMLLIFQFKLSSFWYFGIWILFNVLGLFFQPNALAWWVHVGGFGWGLLVAYLYYPNLLKQFPLLYLLNQTHRRSTLANVV